MDTEIDVADRVIHEHRLTRGGMKLASDESQRYLLQALSTYHKKTSAGGSAANTVVGLVQYGGSASYTGKIGSDRFGTLYQQSMVLAGVDFNTGPSDQPTGTCIVLVTPDGERTMQTYLGASATLSATDVNKDQIANSKILYVEGYLWSSPSGTKAAESAIECARSNNVQVALSLSDPFIVKTHLSALQTIIPELVDIIFCNEHEASEYTGHADPADSLRYVSRQCERIFLTMGERGSLTNQESDICEIPAYPTTPVDTTGAGDMYAGGVLYGLTHGFTAQESALLGSYAAAKVVAVYGPRLDENLEKHVSAILPDRSNERNK